MKKHFSPIQVKPLTIRLRREIVVFAHVYTSIYINLKNKTQMIPCKLFHLNVV